MPESNDNKNGNNSLFLYTALIFIAAIIIIIFAYFSQTHVERAQPSISPEVQSAAAPYDPEALSPVPSDVNEPQGIAKTAAQLSQDNMELLEENRTLHNRVDELEARQKLYEPLIKAYDALSSGNKERAKLLIEEVDSASLSAEAKTLYNYITSN